MSTLGCPDWSIDDLCRHLPTAGVRGVDFRGYGDALDVTTHPLFTRHVQQTRHTLHDAGLTVAGISSSIRLCDPARRQSNLDEARRTLDVCRALGASHIRLFGGGDPADRAATASVGRGCLRDILALPGASAVRWLIETHDHWLTADHVLLLLDGAPEAATGVLWDFGQPDPPQHPDTFLAAAGDRVVATHIKDALPVNHCGPDAPTKTWRIALPGRGALPLRGAVRGLRRLGFDGWWVFEHERRWHPELEPMEEALPVFVRWMSRVLAEPLDFDAPTRNAWFIPHGSSTTSKRPTLRPEEPGVLVRGLGCRVWDDRGREFLDFRNALGPVTLGYQYPAVDEAVRRQLQQGVLFSHPHPLEGELAERLCDLIPCAEKARFLKTGGEAIAATIKLARRVTGRGHVIHVGYNGWLSVLAAGGMALPGRPAEGVPRGVPPQVSQLHHACAWADDARLRQLFHDLDGQVAALVVACDYARMAEGATFLPSARRLTHEHGAALIFDEIVTGFRVALGGAQSYFGVTPDLAVFAKGIANGLPLSVYLGGAPWMDACLDTAVTSTHGGETLSLAAALATIDTYTSRPVVDHLWRMGHRLWSAVNAAAARRGLPLQLSGFWPCVAWQSPDPALLARLFRAALGRGVILNSVSYVNFSVQDADADDAVQRLEAALDDVARSS